MADTYLGKKLNKIIAVTQMVKADYLVKNNLQRFAHDELKQGYEITVELSAPELEGTVLESSTQTIWLTDTEYQILFAEDETVSEDNTDN